MFIRYREYSSSLPFSPHSETYFRFSVDPISIEPSEAVDGVGRHVILSFAERALCWCYALLSNNILARRGYLHHVEHDCRLAHGALYGHKLQVADWNDNFFRH